MQTFHTHWLNEKQREVTICSTFFIYCAELAWGLFLKVPDGFFEKYICLCVMTDALWNDKVYNSRVCHLKSGNSVFSPKSHLKDKAH